MSTAFEIPSAPQPQSYAVTLSGVVYQLTVRWNQSAQAWVVDIADANQVRIISGIPLVTGSNLLEQYDYLDLGGALYAQTDSAPDAPPTFDNLGSTGHLYWVTS